MFTNLPLEPEPALKLTLAFRNRNACDARNAVSLEKRSKANLLSIQ